MRLEIRRNRDIVASVTCDVNIEKLKALMPEMTEEQERLDAWARIKRKEAEDMVWQYAADVHLTDLDGHEIHEDTHEIGYDWGEPDERGVCLATCMWIRPKESEWNRKERGRVAFGPEEVLIISK